jgi:hypothetical protein
MADPPVKIIDRLRPAAPLTSGQTAWLQKK